MNNTFANGFLIPMPVLDFMKRGKQFDRILTHSTTDLGIREDALHTVSTRKLWNGKTTLRLNFGP